MKNFLIVDDHEVVRNGLKYFLAAQFSEIEFGEAQNAAEFFRRVKEKKWDIIILDINMPGRSGLDILQQMKEDQIKFPVLVLSMHPEEQIALKALKLGAYGYLSKDSSNAQIVRVVCQILSGKKYIPESVAEQLAAHLENPTDVPPHNLLSVREYQTLILMASGKTPCQIAESLSLSPPTISTFRSRILEKMGMKSNAELIAYAIKNRLV